MKRDEFPIYYIYIVAVITIASFAGLVWAVLSSNNDIKTLESTEIPIMELCHLMARHSENLKGKVEHILHSKEVVESDVEAYHQLRDVLIYVEDHLRQATADMDVFKTQKFATRSEINDLEDTIIEVAQKQKVEEGEKLFNTDYYRKKLEKYHRNSELIIRILETRRQQSSELRAKRLSIVGILVFTVSILNVFM